MKKSLFLAIATLFATVSFAQQQLAILNHQDTVSAFYGVNAFIEAYTAAESGDMITLSSGTFSVQEITKAITIRGNGFEDDTIAGTKPTILSRTNGYLLLNVPQDSINSLVIEGIRLPNINFRQLYSPQFTKCRFGKWQGTYDTYMTDAIFTNCVIDEVNLYHGAPQGTHVNTNFVNCIILNIPFTNRTPNNCHLINCIVGLNNSDISVVNSDGPAYTCINCILFSSSPSNNNDNTASCSNCIGINVGQDSSLSYFNNALNGNHNFNGYSSVFKYFWGELYNGVIFELQDTIANTILGTDGTEIGIYGGMVPYTSRVNTPRYVRCNVAPHTTLDGKLSVDIEVVSE